MSHYAVSIFHTNTKVNEALSALRNAGATEKDLTLLASAEASEVADVVGIEAEENALQGALAGTSIGGALGALGSVVALTIPGVGLILASGVIATLSGSVIGGYLGTLYGMRAETNEVIDMKNVVTPDSMILIVQAEDQESAQKYSDLLENFGSQWTEIIANEDINA